MERIVHVVMFMRANLKPKRETDKSLLQFEGVEASPIICAHRDTR